MLIPTTESGHPDWLFLCYEKRTKVLDGQLLHRCSDCRLWFPREEYLQDWREPGELAPKCAVCWERPYLVMSGAA